MLLSLLLNTLQFNTYVYYYTIKALILCDIISVLSIIVISQYTTVLMILSTVSGFVWINILFLKKKKFCLIAVSQLRQLDDVCFLCI